MNCNSTARQTLIDIYLDFWNNYLTEETYADRNNLQVEHAKALIDLARNVYSSEHPHK